MGLTRSQIIKKATKESNNHYNLDHTSFKDAEAFQRVCDRHNLEYKGRVEHEYERKHSEDVTSFTYVWANEATGKAITTQSNPVTGHPGKTNLDGGREGWCDHTAIHCKNDVKALNLLMDVISTAKHVKGMTGMESFKTDESFYHADAVEDHSMA